MVTRPAYRRRPGSRPDGLSTAGTPTGEDGAMTHVGRGSRLALRLGDRLVQLRALADVDLDGDWQVPVLALVPGVQDATGDVEVVTGDGVVTLCGRLVHDDGGLVLRPGGSVVPLPGQRPEQHVEEQRREDVRGGVELPVRAAVLDPRTRSDLADLAFDGATVDVSAGGLRLDPGDDSAKDLPAGARLFVEVELPDDRLVPAVLGLVAPGTDAVHGRFVDIAAADRERLVRLVFAEQRRLLAARRRARGGLPIDHLVTSRRFDPYGP